MKSSLLTQAIPLALTAVVCGILVFIIWIEVLLLNSFTKTDILIQVRWSDVLIGMTIYLKTSVDFAIFIGNLMSTFPGWKNRIMIEVGTAVGNALGTVIVLALWDVFRDIKPLLALMIVWAAVVLFKLAEEGLEHTHEGSYNLPSWFYTLTDKFETVLHLINSWTAPVIDRIMPNLTMRPVANLSMMALFVFSFKVPFVLGLDDFAGYVPVFDIVNVFGFSIGVLSGHMVLNALLFVSPQRTITVVKHPVISLLGSVAFVLLALWGFREVAHLLSAH